MPQTHRESKYSTIAVKVSNEEKEKFRENTNSMSGRLRHMVESWNDVEEEYELRENIENMSLVVLRSYLNCIEKNIQTMEVQKEKLEEKIEELEEDEDPEVLFEVKLDLDGTNI